MENLNASSSEALGCISRPARNPSKVSQKQLKEGSDTETRQPMSPVVRTFLGCEGSPSAKKTKKEEAEITVDAPLYPIMTMTELTAPASMLQYLIDDGKESDDQIQRRERNKDHAKRARLKKKSLFISLQSTVQQLRLENGKLESAIRENIPDGHARISSLDQSNQ